MPIPLAWRPHPWHGIDPGARFPDEITGLHRDRPDRRGQVRDRQALRAISSIDRPQRYSSQCPTLYGFVPQTYCGERVAAYQIAGGPSVTRGDGDPLDVCVLTDRAVTRGEILLEARPIGGLRMVERGEADDKIIAVLLGDPTYGDLRDVADLPRAVVDRLRHYFLTYKTIPGDTPPSITVDPVYGRRGALEVLRAAREDYRAMFGAR